MTTDRYTDKLAKAIIYVAIAAVILTLCWYFKNIIIYILIAVVMSLIAKPIMKFLRKIRIKGRGMGEGLMAIISMIIILGISTSVVTLIIPILSGIIKGISLESSENSARHIAIPLSNLNEFLRDSFPQLGKDFRIEIAVAQELTKFLDVSIFSSVIGSAANIVSKFGVGLFSVVFIGFFFIRNEDLFGRIITSVIPDRHEEEVFKSLSDIFISEVCPFFLLSVSTIARASQVSSLW